MTSRVGLAVAMSVCAFVTISFGADPSAPAKFTITDTIQQKNPGAFTATIGAVPNRALTAGGFEPMIFRTKVEPNWDSLDEVAISFSPWDFYGVYKDGFWNGAEVRVYRPRNGKLIKIRHDEVSDYTSSGWHPYYVGGRGDKDKNIVNPQANRSELRVTLPTDRTYWFCLKSVDSENRESAPSNAAALRLEKHADKKAERNSNTIKFKKYPDIVHNQATGVSSEIPAPTNLKASMREDGVLVLSWTPVKHADLAGYRLYWSEYDPAQHKGFHFRLKKGSTDPALALKKNDLVFINLKKYTDSRKAMIFATRQGIKGLSARQNASPLGFPTIRDYPDEEEGMSWKFVKHPEPLPDAFKNPGETCMQIDLAAGKAASVYCFGYGGMDSTWWRPLQPGLEYTIEVWLKGKGQGSATFEIGGFYGDPKNGIQPIRFDISPEWKKHSATFKPTAAYNGRGIRFANLKIEGEGNFYIDNLFIYPTKDGLLLPSEMMIERVKESGLEALRYHNHIKSGKSYDMAMVTNANGVVGTRGNSQPNNRNTIAALLDFTKAAGSNPWFQIEMCMSEAEWLGFMEYIAAPYNPAKDTPETKPWAYKRYRQGQERPWVDEFNKIYFEISNETWNWMFKPWIFYDGAKDEVTGQSYLRGATYGMFHEYVVSILKSSPYWTPELARKFKTVLGGWKSMSNSYTNEAAKHAPSADYITCAGYNGGWDAGVEVGKPTPEGLYRVMMYWVINQKGDSADVTLLNSMKAEDLVDRAMKFGSYEAGPGYALPGTLKGNQYELQDQVQKSLAAGMATTDVFLGRAYAGWKTQNFFTLSFNRRNWTSHAPEIKGAHPYPSWMGLSLFNNHGTGDFLLTKAESVPTNDFTFKSKKKKQEKEYKDRPQVGIYATAKGKRVNVFLLSRKLPGFMDDNGDGKVGSGDDGYTDVTVQLPFSKADSVTLYKMTGNPFNHNLDEQKIKIVKQDGIPFNRKFALTPATTGDKRNGLPPASVYLYVFEGANIRALNNRPIAAMDVPDRIVVGQPATFTSTCKDPDNDQLAVSWETSDGQTATGKSVSFTFSKPGEHRVNMTVNDGKGGTAKASVGFETLIPYRNHLLRIRYLAASWDSHKPKITINGDQLQFESPGRLEQHGSFAVATLADPLAGDRSLAVHVTGRKSKGDKKLSKSGLIMMSGLDNGSPKVILAIDGEGKARMFTHRKPQAEIPMTAPCWLRLTRNGSTFTGYASKDGKSWQKVGAVNENIGDTYHAGLFGVYGYWGGPETMTIDKLEVK